MATIHFSSIARFMFEKLEGMKLTQIPVGLLYTFKGGQRLLLNLAIFQQSKLNNLVMNSQADQVRGMAVWIKSTLTYISRLSVKKTFFLLTSTVSAFSLIPPKRIGIVLNQQLSVIYRFSTLLAIEFL